jgi:ABC-type uncharacterized transport system substrate-binding protein
MRFSRRARGLAVGVVAALAPFAALAHPHVFVEANVEILRDAQGAVTEIRHVWRFDELFSSTVLLDFDENGNGKLEPAELDAVSETVTKSIAEYDFYTEFRLGDKPLDYVAPRAVMVAYEDEQVLMFFPMKLKEPAPAAGGFRLAVADTTYYVAIDIADDAAVQVTGPGAQDCKTDIARPDFDALIAKNSKRLGDYFQSKQVESVELGDEWLTWISLTCK